MGSRAFFSSVNRSYAEYGITIPESGPFEPGKHCQGKDPIKESQECYMVCFGTQGACSIGGLIPPCETMCASLGSSIQHSMEKGIMGI